MSYYLSSENRWHVETREVKDEDIRLPAIRQIKLRLPRLGEGTHLNQRIGSGNYPESASGVEPGTPSTGVPILTRQATDHLGHSGALQYREFCLGVKRKVGCFGVLRTILAEA